MAYFGRLISSWVHNRWNGVWNDPICLVILTGCSSIHLDVKDYETENKMHIVIISRIQTRKNGNLNFDCLVLSLTKACNRWDLSWGHTHHLLWCPEYFACSLSSVNNTVYCVLISKNFCLIFGSALHVLNCSIFSQILGGALFMQKCLVVWKLQS